MIVSVRTADRSTDNIYLQRMPRSSPYVIPGDQPERDAQGLCC